jgi:tetratricopeptide (TPR) repeat protein
MSLKIFFHYFPKTAWLILLLAFAINFTVPELEPLSYVFIKITIIYLCLKVATIIHECGHLISAYWVGGVAKRMIIGRGHEVYRTEWRGVKIILKSIPIGGLAISIFSESRFIAWRYAFYAFGGILFNVVAALLFYLVFDYNTEFLFSEHSIDVASCFIFANAICLINLFPFYIVRDGARLPTDGLILLQILVGAYKENLQNLKYSEEYFNAYEYFEKREYDKAYSICQSLHEKIEDELSALSLMSTILIKQCELERALSFQLVLVEKIDSKALKKQKGLIYNNIAWTYLLMNDLEKAYYYSSLAIKAMNRSQVVGGTYGAILVERGNTDLGMQWISQNIDMKHPNSETLSASIHMMLAYHQKNNFKERDKHRKYVMENVNLLEKDVLLIWSRCLEKMNTNE